MDPFYLILSFNESTQEWEPGMFVYQTLETAEQAFWKLTDYHNTVGKHKLIKVAHYETIDEIENYCSEENQ